MEEKMTSKEKITFLQNEVERLEIENKMLTAQLRAVEEHDVMEKIDLLNEQVAEYLKLCKELRVLKKDYASVIYEVQKIKKKFEKEVSKI